VEEVIELILECNEDVATENAREGLWIILTI